MTRARPYSDPYLPAGRLGYVVQLYDGSFEDWSLFRPGEPSSRGGTVSDPYLAGVDLGLVLHPDYPVENKAAP